MNWNAPKTVDWIDTVLVTKEAKRNDIGRLTYLREALGWCREDHPTCIYVTEMMDVCPRMAQYLETEILLDAKSLARLN